MSFSEVINLHQISLGKNYRTLSDFIDLKFETVTLTNNLLENTILMDEMYDGQSLEEFVRRYDNCAISFKDQMTIFGDLLSSNF